MIFLLSNYSINETNEISIKYVHYICILEKPLLTFIICDELNTLTLQPSEERVMCSFWIGHASKTIPESLKVWKRAQGDRGCRHFAARISFPPVETWVRRFTLWKHRCWCGFLSARSSLDSSGADGRLVWTVLCPTERTSVICSAWF